MTVPTLHLHLGPLSLTFILIGVGPNSFKLDGSVGAGTAAVILDNIDKIRRAFRAVDPRGTGQCRGANSEVGSLRRRSRWHFAGLVTEKDFRKVLYLEGGVPYNDVSIILATAPVASHSPSHRNRHC